MKQIFKRLLKKFQIVTSLPYNHYANGKVEAHVKVVKKLIKKVKENKEDSSVAILEWRNTPVKDKGASPAQLLMVRATKHLLPVLEEYLKPQIKMEVEDKNEMKQLIYKRQIRFLAL